MGVDRQLSSPSFLVALITGPTEMWLNSNLFHSLIYWDNPRNSGIAFGPVLVCLLAVRYISLISVIGNLALALVTATLSFRIYKSVLAAVNKSQEGHPFRQLLEVDVTVPNDKLSQIINSIVSRINSSLSKLKDIFLVRDVLESVKLVLECTCCPTLERSST